MIELHERQYISDQTYNFLSKGGKRTSVFYLLPKIHKNLNFPRGRPIVSSVDCPTERISMMLDTILQPLLTDTKSYIKDTPDFLRKISTHRISTAENFFTLDVSSLYTNIPLEESLRIMEEEFFPKTKCVIPINFLSKMLELILKCNNFTFRVKLPIPRLFLYRESSYIETHLKGESCFKHFTRTAFDNILKEVRSRK